MSEGPNCETDFRYSRCIRQRGVEALVLSKRIAKYVLWKAENDIIEELLDLDMERNPESLWWISTFQDENMRTLRVGVRDRALDLLLCEVFDVLVVPFHP